MIFTIYCTLYNNINTFIACKIETLFEQMSESKTRSELLKILEEVRSLFNSALVIFASSSCAIASFLVIGIGLYILVELSLLN